MMRLRTIVTFLCCLVLFLTMMATYRLFSHLDRLEQQLCERLAQTLHHPLKISHIHVSFAYGLNVRLDGFQIFDNAQSQAPFLKASHIQTNVALRPLLHRHIVFKDILCLQPTIDMRANFARLFPTQAGDSASSWKIFIRHIQCRDLTLLLPPTNTGLSHPLYIDRFTQAFDPHNDAHSFVSANSPQGPITIQASEGLASLARHKIPLQMFISIDGKQFIARNETHGLLDIQDGLAYQLHLTGHLQEKFPGSYPFGIELKKLLSAQAYLEGRNDHYDIRQGHISFEDIDLSRLIPQSHIQQGELSLAHLQSPLQLTVKGILAAYPFTSQGHLAIPSSVHTQHGQKDRPLPVDLTIHQGEDVLTLGGLLAQNGSIFHLQGHLPELPFPRQDGRLERVSLNGAILLDHTQPTDAFLWRDPLHHLRIKGTMSAQRAQLWGAQWRNLNTDFVQNATHLYWPHIQAYGMGHWQQGAFSYDLAQPTIFSASAHSLFIPYKTARTVFDLTHALDGTVQIDGQVTGQGQNFSQSLRHLDGHLGLSIANGTIGRDFLIHFLKISLPSFNVTLPVACLGTHLQLRNSHSDIDALAMQVLSMRTDGVGAFDFLSHLMDITLNTQLHIAGPGTIYSYVNISRSWERPHITVLPMPQWPLQTENTQQFCTDLLSHVREGHEGPQPDMSHITTRGLVDRSLTKKLPVKPPGLQTGERALGMGLDIVNGTTGDDGTSATGKILNSFGL